MDIASVDAHELSAQRIAAIAIGKTVAYVLYGYLTIILVFSALLVLGRFPLYPTSSQAAVVIVLVPLSQVVVFYLVMRGALPGTSGIRAQPFSEAQLGAGLNAISLALFLWPGTGRTEYIIELFLNVSGILWLAVYFVVKALLTRRLPLGVFLFVVWPIVALWLNARG